MSTARLLMVQGTSSNAGKSFLVAGLLRLLARRGLRAAPFKAQNMARNAAVTASGGEIGRAQADQAFAAGTPSSVDMNPILLKPEKGMMSQVVVSGRMLGTMSYRDYAALKPELQPLILQALGRLRAQYDFIVIEGAGSPAEINLSAHDIVNMFVARESGSPVLLVTDVDRGGAFASLYGTWALQDPADREQIVGFVFNRLRGDANLLAEGYAALEAKTGVPVLGALPHLDDLGLPEEDSLGLERRQRLGRASRSEIEITVIRTPFISNYDEFYHLERVLHQRYSEAPRDGIGTDLVILPGSKRTLDDLEWLRDSGWAEVLQERAKAHQPVLGICGGCQILGRSIRAQGRTFQGLALLPIDTEFTTLKQTEQVQTTLAIAHNASVQGYEIHRGHATRHDQARPFATIASGDTTREDGALVGAVAGTMVHGLFTTARTVEGLVEWIRPGLDHARAEPRSPYDRIADAIEQHLDLSTWLETR